MTAERRGDGVRYHEVQAAGWDDRYRSGGFKRRADLFRTAMLPLLDCRGRWLDAGCGSGYFSRILAAAGAEVTGVDAADNMVAAARAKAAADPAAGRLRFDTVETVEALPFADAAFHGLVSLSVLEYVAEPDRALAEYARVLRPGAQTLISIPSAASPVRMAGRLVQRLKRRRAGGTAYLEASHFEISRRVIAPLFADRGLAVDRVWGFDPVLPSWLGRRAPSLFYVLATRR